MSEKTFFLTPEQIDRLVEDPRACLATDRIVVDGEPVGYMYREPSGADEDSGWRFMAGDESAEYMADANNIGVYALNSLANYDRDIIALLQSPPGSYFAREEPGGKLVSLPDVGDQTAAGGESAHPGLHPDYSVVEGDYRITAEWVITLPGAFNRRVEDNSLVIWRPGLTVHLVAWDNTPGDSINDRVEQLLASVSPDAELLVRSDDEGLTRVKYFLDEDVATITTFVVTETSQILASLYFEDEPDGLTAEEIASSIRPYDESHQGSTH